MLNCPMYPAVNAKLNVAEVAKKASVFAATLPAMILSSPAYALVSATWCYSMSGANFTILSCFKQLLCPLPTSLL
jgi:hypothetical protein